jgi:F-box interacting protein
LCIPNSPIEILSVDFESSLNNDFIDFESSSNNDYALLNPNFPCVPLQIKGSCRGFICLRGSLNLYIWNPSTGVHRKIPLSPFDFKLKGRYFGHLYGFGYDQSRDDYLVVSICCDPTYDSNSSHLEFFSLRDNTWKEIEGTQFPYMNVSSHPYPKVGPLFNGAIHLLARRCDLSVYVIVAFDLMKRKFLEMPFPNDDNMPSHCDLWVFGEFLSILANNSENKTVEIWVMKEYTVHSSWTKILVLPVTYYLSLIYSTKNGDFIGVDGDLGLVKYNDKGQLLGQRSYGKDSRVSQEVMYTESLLSLPGNGEQI